MGLMGAMESTVRTGSKESAGYRAVSVHAVQRVLRGLLDVMARTVVMGRMVPMEHQASTDPQVLSAIAGLRG